MSDGASARKRYDCPSAQPGMENARPFAVVDGSADEVRVAYFKKSTLKSFKWREQFENKDATRLFRFGARCDEAGCVHFGSGLCRLGQRVASQLPAVVDALPPCLIRPDCRWYAEQGPGVCLRCPQVVTMIPEADTPLNRVAATSKADPQQEVSQGIGPD